MHRLLLECVERGRLKLPPMSRPREAKVKVDGRGGFFFLSLLGERHGWVGLMSFSSVSKHLRRHPVIQALVRPFLVVEGEVLVQAGEQRGYRLILLEVDIFVFDAAPEPFDKEIVEAPTASIHTDADVGLF